MVRPGYQLKPAEGQESKAKDPGQGLREPPARNLGDLAQPGPFRWLLWEKPRWGKDLTQDHFRPCCLRGAFVKESREKFQALLGITVKRWE